MTRISFADAEAYFRWAGGGLPTEAQWELAARAGTAGPAADQLADYALYAENSGGAVHHVAQKKPNAFGLFDMLGNVVEYTADLFDSSTYAATASTTDPARTTPGQPDAGHVPRGGLWADPAKALRVSKRFFGADEGTPVSGIRCTLPAR